MFTHKYQGVEFELQQTQGVTIKELWLPSVRYRLIIAFTMQMCQQFTGNTSLAYYAPQIFASVGAGGKSLLISGFFGLAKVFGVSCFIVCILSLVLFVAFVFDKYFFIVVANWASSSSFR